MLENNLSRRLKITWITADYFVDCDFNPIVLKELLLKIDIHWIILLPFKNARFSKDDFTELSKFNGLTIEFLYSTCRARNPKMLLFYRNLYNKITKIKSDLTYFNDAPTSPYILPLYSSFKKSRTIVTAHDGNVKPSFKIPWLSKIVFTLAFKRIRYVNMFSLTQASIFKSAFKGAQIFLIPLSLKDFGKSNFNKRKDNVVFLFFGSINSNKNLALLIDAACMLYDQGVRGFKISIHGACDDWKIYQSKMQYPEIFEYDIRQHKNAEIPDLFTQSHYGVFPYKELSQSGALKVAFNYNLPVLVSDLQGFKEEVIDGINGFIFKSNNVSNLAGLMTRLISDHMVKYNLLQESTKLYNQEHYSHQIIAGQYLQMFDKVFYSKNR